MLPNNRGLVLFLTSSLLAWVSSLAEDAVDTCYNAGFDKNSLLCSNCDNLHEFGLDSLRSGCESCCVQDKVNEVTKKHHFARLEVCG